MITKSLLIAFNSPDIDDLILEEPHEEQITNGVYKVVSSYNRNGNFEVYMIPLTSILMIKYTQKSDALVVEGEGRAVE